MYADSAGSATVQNSEFTKAGFSVVMAAAVVCSAGWWRWLDLQRHASATPHRTTRAAPTTMPIRTEGSSAVDSSLAVPLLPPLLLGDVGARLAVPLLPLLLLGDVGVRLGIPVGGMRGTVVEGRMDGDDVGVADRPEFGPDDGAFESGLATVGGVCTRLGGWAGGEAALVDGGVDSNCVPPARRWHTVHAGSDCNMRLHRGPELTTPYWPVASLIATEDELEM